jgi:TetR/AcrR family transcriptional regulator
MASDRKQKILEALAKMLENPKREKITTASLASRLSFFQAVQRALFRTCCRAITAV